MREIEILLIISGLFLIGATFFFVLNHLTKEKQEKDKEKNFYKENKMTKRLLRYSWYDKLQQFLKESDSSHWLELYIAIHLMAIVFIIYSLIVIWPMKGFGEFLTGSIRVFFVTILPINIIIHSKGKRRREQLKLELCNIQVLLYFQTKIGTPEDVILISAARVAKDPLKDALEYLAHSPKIKKKQEEAFKRLRDISSIIEIKSFSFILEQRQYTGSSEENHKAQANAMKRSKRMRRRILRQYKRSKLVLSAVMLFVCYSLLLIVPLIQEVARNVDLMFR